MTAFVLGATGFVGREVTRQLCVRGTKVFAHVRPDSKQLSEWRDKLGALGAEVDTTAWDAAAMAARFREVCGGPGPDQIYVLIGTTRSRAKSDSVAGDIYEAIDFGLTKIAVDAARASERKPRLVYLSGIGASASARGAYMRARGKAEDYVRESGLPWVIARPAIITGDRDESRIGERSAAIIGDGLRAGARVFGGKRLRERYRSTTPDILASALIRLGEAPDVNRIANGAELR